MDKSIIWYQFNAFGLIAQWIEHPPSKRVVAGSSPARSVFQKRPFLRAVFFS